MDEVVWVDGKGGWGRGKGVEMQSGLYIAMGGWMVSGGGGGRRKVVVVLVVGLNRLSDRDQFHVSHVPVVDTNC